MTADNNLKRFLDAQQREYAIALLEIKNGRKRSHWMWYIFPQIQGLGYSETSKYYAIKDIAEAKAYILHPILGNRLIEISDALLNRPTNNASAIFGSPDDMKLKSSMTLFSSVKNANPVFDSVIDKFFKGSKDAATLRILNKQ